VRSTSETFSEARSTTDTLFSFALATNTRRPSGDSARSVGCWPTAMRFTIWYVLASTTASSARLQSETKICAPSREARQV
jgi:hypothetical protein